MITKGNIDSYEKFVDEANKKTLKSVTKIVKKLDRYGTKGSVEIILNFSFDSSSTKIGKRTNLKFGK